MVTEGKPNDAVWMTIDEQVVSGRLVRFIPDKQMVVVKYSELGLGDGQGCRTCFTTSVFPEDQWEEAKKYAMT